MRRFACSLLLAALLPAAAWAQEPGYPTYCCTGAGRFGPFSNGTVNVGERCSATDTTGVRHVGTACHGPANPLTIAPMDTTGYADRCCTDVGVLGPVAGATWLEGDKCAVTAADGSEHEGIACYGVSGLLERAPHRPGPRGSTRGRLRCGRPGDAQNGPRRRQPSVACTDATTRFAVTPG